MSSKSTIVLTSDNEHWYEDCAEPLIDASGQRKDAITLEFDKKNIRVDCNDQWDLIVTITNPDCDLHKIVSAIREAKFRGSG